MTIYRLDLLHELIRRDIKANYQGTILGFAWTLIMPFLHLAIFYFLFKMVLNTQTPRFTIFALMGIMAYGWFQASLSQAAGSIISDRHLILRPRFPGAILPVVAVASHMLHFIFALPILLLIVISEEHRLSTSLVALPLVMGVQFLLILGLGYLAAVTNVIYRDTKNILDALLRLLYFLTPVFYDPSMVPLKYREIYNINPLVPILQSYRNIVINGTMPPWNDLAIVAIFSLGLTWVGLHLFQQQSYRFLEEL